MRTILTFVLGALVSIPLSILANLLTPRWQRYWGNRNDKARAKSRQQDESFSRMVEWFVEHPSALNAYLLNGLIRFVPALIVFVSFIGIAGVVAGLGLFSDAPDEVITGLLLFLILTVTATLGVAARTTVSAFRILIHVALQEGWPMDPDTFLAWKPGSAGYESAHDADSSASEGS